MEQVLCVLGRDTLDNRTLELNDVGNDVVPLEEYHGGGTRCETEDPVPCS